MKKSTIITLISSFSICLACAAALILTKNSWLKLGADAPEYGVELNASNRVSEITSGEATKTVDTALGNPIEFSYAGASVVEGKHVGLAANGSIVNKTPLTGSLSVLSKFSGAIDVYGSGDGIAFTRVDALTSEAKFDFAKTWDYVKFVATSAAEIDSLQVKYSCTSRFTGVEQDNKIVGFNSVTNIGNVGQSGNRGWGSNFWAAMNFDKGQGGRFHFYSELGGLHDIVWDVTSSFDNVKFYVFLNGARVGDLFVPNTGHWYSDSTPTGAQITVEYDLLQGWNELYYLIPDVPDPWCQIGSITVKGLENRRFDPTELDRDVKSLHFEAEQGNYKGKNGGARFYGDGYSGTEMLGAIEEDGAGTAVTFYLPPSEGAGQYDFTARIGCGNGTKMKVFVDDLINEWLEDCTTTTYEITDIPASPNWDVMQTTPSVRITLPGDWCRIRVEFGGNWFTLDSFDLVRVNA